MEFIAVGAAMKGILQAASKSWQSIAINLNLYTDRFLPVNPQYNPLIEGSEEWKISEIILMFFA